MNTKNDGVFTVENVAATATSDWAKGIGIGELEVRQVRRLYKP